MKTAAFRSAVFALFFSLGISIISITSPRFVGGRDPAAVRASYDFSHLRGSALNSAMKGRALAGLSVHKTSSDVGLALGHFTLVNPAGEKTLACREYEKIQLAFEAEGVSVDGNKPVMEVEGECRFTEDLAFVQPVMIPVSKILGEKPADGEFRFMEGQDVAVRFSHVLDEWPRRWILTDVRFVGKKSSFAISRNEIHDKLGNFFSITLGTE